MDICDSTVFRLLFVAIWMRKICTEPWLVLGFAVVCPYFTGQLHLDLDLQEFHFNDILRFKKIIGRLQII